MLPVPAHPVYHYRTRSVESAARAAVCERSKLNPMTAFSKEYVTYVLNENFEDAKALFLAPLMSIHYAHLAMLTAQKIVSKEDAHSIRLALDGVSQDAVRKAPFDGGCEDLFYYVERLIVEGCGPDTAGRLHTARSRNDIDMTMYRMRQREFVLNLLEATLDLRGALLSLADRHRDTILAVHTHTQRAQPSTVAHYMLAMVEQVERDASRLMAAYERTNRNPLGACAITGTGFAIDRQLTSDLLGFSGPTCNTYGSIATADYLLESMSASAVLLTGLGRFVQDMLLWSTAEFHYLRLGDGFVQSSSIMPQKRNPVSLEHARAISSKALGQALAVITAVHNTPFGDIVDTEDDLQPLVFAMFRDAERAVRLVAAAMRTAEFDAVRLETHAGDGWTTLTELADTLVRDHGLPFRAAHAIAGRLIAARAAEGTRPLADLLAEASRDLLGAPIRYTETELAEILSPRHFVAVRRTWGGPAPEETARASQVSRLRLEDDEAWRRAAAGALRSAEEKLAERAAML
jgi:argininosuccinate lyase